MIIMKVTNPRIATRLKTGSVTAKREIHPLCSMAFFNLSRKTQINIIQMKDPRKDLVIVEI
jgi:hypothetical protein